MKKGQLLEKGTENPVRKELLIVERLKLMFEFDKYVFDNIMNDIDFYIMNSTLKILISLYKGAETEIEKYPKEYIIMKLINEL